MAMPPALRRAVLSVHVICSVGWIGAAVAYLALGIAAELSKQPGTVRAAWIAMELTGWYVILPAAGLAVLTGLVISLGTQWGLLRHYWVLFALVLSTLSLVVLVLHMPTVTSMADQARTIDDTSAATLGGDILHPALGLVVLIVVAVLNIYKPRGLTAYGHRQQARQKLKLAAGTSRANR
jgi:hypothetical protein